MKTNQITDCLNTMNRPELAAVAKSLHVPVGKSRSNTVSNLTAAIVEKKARFTVQFTIRSNANPNDRFVPSLFSKKLRTHKSDKVVWGIIKSAA